MRARAGDWPVIHALEDHGPLNVTQLAEVTGMGSQTIRNRLSALTRAGVLVKQVGAPVRYDLAPDGTAAAEVFIRAALADLLDGRDPVPNLSAAMALCVSASDVPAADLAELRDLAGEMTEDD